MPEPLLYLKAMVVAAVASAIFVLATVGARRSASQTWLNSATVLAIALGLAVGYELLDLHWVFPPKNALDRFLVIILPVAIIIELITACNKSPRWLNWLLRLSLAASLPRILLHQSIYMGGPFSNWTTLHSIALLVVTALLMAGVWVLLAWLSERANGVSLSIAMILPIQSTGITVMMAGYIKGGAAAIPLVASLLFTALSCCFIVARSNKSIKYQMPALLNISVVGLFSLLMIGHFFGELSASTALIILLAPQLCWVTELPQLRRQKPWVIGAIRIVIVLLPLVIILVQAKQTFDQEMAPLL